MPLRESLAEIEEWLVDEALGTPGIAESFSGLCARMRAAGVPVDRAKMSWATLHPLVQAETIVWYSGGEIEHERFLHREAEREEWLNSPLKAIVDSGDARLRRRLAGGNAELDFPLCVDLRQKGYTDYLVLATRFAIPTTPHFADRSGLIGTWATLASDGFDDAAIDTIELLQRRLAVVCRAEIVAMIAETIAATYLGPRAGGRVLAGQIRHGDGETIEAIIFYCDLRGSTALAGRLGQQAYLQRLNAYFEATAGAIVAEGGEILDFIGDAVLAVFPTDAGGFAAAAGRALAALEAVRRRLSDAVADGTAMHCGIAVTSGSVMFGNIGIADRLTFSVIGQTVNRAARIEAMTKTLDCAALVTAEVAAFAPDRFAPAGRFVLEGFADEVELFRPT